MIIYWKDEGVNDNGYQVGPAWHEIPNNDGSITTIPVLKVKSGYSVSPLNIGNGAWAKYASLYRWAKRMGYELTTV